ncbi:MAG: glycosyltransferase [Bacteroidota bacterium]|nr:glycosyltransferase [Bacteroidota bacterium]
MSSEKIPIVSVVSFTYNHEKYIRQALNGFVNQKTNFEYEIIIHDDASTDNTQSIIKEYEHKHPDLFKPIYQNENQKSKGGGIVTRTAFSKAKGKYIALCEGDDYWTDPLKLQKQIDFLEKNPSYSGCFHQANVLHEDGSFTLMNNYQGNTAISFMDLIKKNMIATASCVYRRQDFHNNMPEWFYTLSAGDWAFHLLSLQKGDLYYMNDCMSVYRQHSGGAWSGLQKEDMVLRGVIIMQQLNEAFEYKYDKYFKAAIEEREKKLIDSKNKTLVDKGIGYKIKKIIKGLIGA